MTEKITKKDMFKEIANVATELGRTDIVDFANHEYDLLVKKSNSKTETKVQKENNELMNVIVDVLTDIAGDARITDIQAKNEKLAALSNQKMSALLKKLVDNKVVNKKIEKKIALYYIN